MRSINVLGFQPVSLPLAAEEVLEFHAARLLLLLHLCGAAGRIDGLTKMAKLDFFARYPDFFEAARAATQETPVKEVPDFAHSQAVEAAMIRHHYGPWDKRYYHVLAHLEAKQLITVTKKGNAYSLQLTQTGKTRAKLIAEHSSFGSIADRMREIKQTFGNKSGASLKNLIYQLFDKEIAQQTMGQVITQ